MKFEFIDYDGGFPNLCSGRLKFKADGKVYEDAEVYSDVVYFKDGLTDFWEIISEHKQKVLDLLDQFSIEELTSVSPHEKLMQCMCSEQEY